MFNAVRRFEIMLTGIIVLILTAAAAIFSISADAYEILPTKNSPLVTDKKNRRVLIYAEINSDNLLLRNTHFGIVFEDGKFSDKAILRAYCNHLDFYDALLAIGARPGDNLTKGSNNKHVEGDELIVTATWPGLSKELTLNDIFYDSSGKGFKIKFGGNRVAAAKENTGCITCLESCWVGITSNAAYSATSSLKRLLSPNSHFKANFLMLPAKEGHPVIITYKLVDKRDIQ